MALDADDLAAIGSLMDQKLERSRSEDRRRRRFWLWFWIVLFVVSSVASWMVAQRLIDRFKAELAQRDAEFQAAKLSYQAQLKKSEAMQQERAQAAANVGYQADASQADYDATLIRGMFQMINQAAEANRKMAELADDPDADLDDLTKHLESLGDSTKLAADLIGTMMLRNTDPTQNTPEERLLAGDDGGTAISQPVEQATPSPTVPRTKESP